MPEKKLKSKHFAYPIVNIDKLLCFINSLTIIGMDQHLIAISYICGAPDDSFANKIETQLNDGFKPCQLGVNLYGIPLAPMLTHTFCKYDTFDIRRLKETWKCEIGNTDDGTSVTICKASYLPRDNPIEHAKFDDDDDIRKPLNRMEYECQNHMSH